MAHKYSARMNLRLVAEETLDPTTAPYASGASTLNSPGTYSVRNWSDGQASGQIDAVYRRVQSSLASSTTDTYDVLAAGGLQTPSGSVIDLDELKGLVIKCTAGEVKLVATAANGLGCFTAASEGLQLKAAGGLRAVALDFGPDGLDVTTASQFAITETSGAASAGYELSFIGAE
jgi:hypothetical protein